MELVRQSESCLGVGSSGLTQDSWKVEMTRASGRTCSQSSRRHIKVIDAVSARLQMAEAMTAGTELKLLGVSCYCCAFGCAAMSTSIISSMPFSRLHHPPCSRPRLHGLMQRVVIRACVQGEAEVSVEASVDRKTTTHSENGLLK